MSANLSTMAPQPPVRLAAACILAGATVWAAVLGGLAAVLLSGNARAAFVAWIDARDLVLPWYGALSGERVLNKVVDKLGPLAFSVVPILLLETLAVGIRQGSLWRLARLGSRDARIDLLVYALNFLGLWRYLSIILTLGLALVAGRLAEMVIHGFVTFDLRIATGTLVVDATLAFLVFTFCDYWNHRLQHRHPLWALHRYHHSAQEMTVLNLWRAHPGVAAVEPLIKLWPLALFDVSPAVVTIVGMVVVSYEYLIHSNVRWNWGWFGRWVLIPPTGHRLHHHVSMECQGKNFGIPVLWDRLFGTFCANPPPDDRLGLDDDAYTALPIHRALWFDLKDLAASLNLWARPAPDR